MSEHIDRILIVGGGTAGWLTALYLSKMLSRRNSPRCKICLVESKEIGKIGVGEATVPSLRDTMSLLGIPEDDWLIQCDGSFKLAIKYVNWTPEPDRVFWHPFTPTIPVIDGWQLQDFWLKHRVAGQGEAFAVACCPAVQLCEANRAPRRLDDPPYSGLVNYAYHLDALLFAEYMKQKALRLGVEHIEDLVIDVDVDERGCVRHIATKEHGFLSGDLYIDCTGFAGLLINRTLREPFLSYGRELFCDAAVTAAVVPHDPTCDRIPPYTTATALGAGWAWEIPTYSRSGVGYVYASRFQSKEDAEAELRRHLGPRYRDGQMRHLTMRVGRTRHAWVQNCVSIGLSSGFVEPLESTGIYLVEVALRYLWRYFPSKRMDAASRDRFNSAIKAYFEHIRDFLVLHYCITKRKDTEFWRYCGDHPAVPESLQSRLQAWRDFLPIPEDLLEVGLFREWSFICMLCGFGYLPDRAPESLEFADGGTAEREFAFIRSRGEALVETSAGHARLLAHLRSRALARRLSQ